MKELSKRNLTVIEKIYEDIDKCKLDVEDMLNEGFNVISTFHAIYPYYRKFEKEIEL